MSSSFNDIFRIEPFIASLWNCRKPTSKGLIKYFKHYKCFFNLSTWAQLSFVQHWCCCPSSKLHKDQFRPQWQHQEERKVCAHLCVQHNWFLQTDRGNNSSSAHITRSDHHTTICFTGGKEQYFILNTLEVILWIRQ